MKLHKITESEIDSTDLLNDESKKKELIGYATYLNIRVSKIFYSDNIKKLLKKCKKAQNEIPKMGNCSFIIEPNNRIENPDGYNSYDEYYKEFDY